MLPAPAPAPPPNIQLPCTSPRDRNAIVYITVVRTIQASSWGATQFQGDLRKPGQVIEFDSLPRPAVLVECAGPIGPWKRGKHRDLLYILWRLDYHSYEWVEIARAQARDWSWSVVFDRPARMALQPRPELVDVLERSRTVAEQILELIRQHLEPEIAAVQASALYAVYESVAGRIVDGA
jgi:hypothetical protein